MRGYCWLSAVGILIALAPAFAQPAPHATPARTAPAAAPVTTMTEIQGAIPESLAGTWLAICNFKRNDGRYLNRWHVYRYTQKDGVWHMEELSGTAPPELDKPLTAADQSGQAYTLDEATLKVVKAALPKFTAKSEATTWSRVIWRAADHFPKEFPDISQGAKFSIEFIDVPSEGIVSGGGAFYAKDVTPTKISGNGAASAVAKSGFVVVPIDIAGPFTMYRLQ